MEKSIKINMPFDKWCKLQKDFERINNLLPENQRLDFEKYKFCSNWGRLSFDLYSIEIGVFKKLREPEFYNQQ
ncbi:hypothetical protein VYE96_09040 [Fusobacterium pseudoperiodonticum]|nr:hypothetical protein [Fusobacterium pseudoperiodonticum]